MHLLRSGQPVGSLWLGGVPKTLGWRPKNSNATAVLRTKGSKVTENRRCAIVKRYESDTRKANMKKWCGVLVVVFCVVVFMLLLLLMLLLH